MNFTAMNDKIYAPMLIPTLCRDKHFIRCIESLKRNTWARFTDVYIGLDYPPSEKYTDGYKKICAYFETGDFSAFKSFHVEKRTANLGSGKNVLALRKAIEAQYPYFIRTDDDAEFSVNFLEYINKALWHYENDPSVIGVAGYSYPLKWAVSDHANTFRMNCFCPMWGTAFYFDRYNALREKILDDYYEKNMEDIIREKKYLKLSQARLADLSPQHAFKEVQSLVKTPSDIGLSIFMPIDGDWCVISPVLTKVRNHGFDGSGEYCQNVADYKGRVITARNYEYSSQPIDEDTSFELIPDDSTDYEANRKFLDEFDSRPAGKLLKARLMILLFRILGREKYKRLWELKRRYIGE